MSDKVFYNSFAMHPDRINIYQQCAGGTKKKHDYSAFMTDEDKETAINRIINSKRTANGKISVNAKRKIQKAIDYLLFVAKEKTETVKSSGKRIRFKVNFITLTLPSKQIHSDKEITNTCLNQFFIELKKFHQVKLYVYRAEKQKNGNIHYHILTDVFINYQDIRDRWNRIINKLGYVDRYKENMLLFHKNGFRFRPELSKNWDYQQQLKAYKNGLKSGFNRPNSTDIHSLKRIRNVRNYLLKYMTKTEDDNNQVRSENSKTFEFTGRVWAACRELTDLKGLQGEVDSFINEMLVRLKRCSAVKIVTDRFFSIFFFDIRELEATPFEPLFLEFIRYLKLKFNIDYQFKTL